MKWTDFYITNVIDAGLVDKAPGIDEWPGDYTMPPPLKTVTMEIQANYWDWYPTGYYLPAGQEATMQVSYICSHWTGSINLLKVIREVGHVGLVV